MKAAAIRKEANYAGVRVTLMGLLDSACCPVQVEEKQWQAFVRRNALEPMALLAVVTDLREFLLPVLASISGSSKLDMAWRAGDGWR